MESFKRALIVLLFVVSLPLFAADPLDTWHWRSPTPTGNPLRAVAWGMGSYVAVGSFGTVLVSSDGRNWENKDSGSRLDLKSVAYGDGRFIAVGKLGEMLVSTDGAAWTPVDSGTFSGLNAIVYGAGRWIAVGQYGTIVISTNGLNWSVVTSGGLEFRDVAWGGGRFVAVGGDEKANSSSYYPKGTPIAAWSTDGKSWRSFDPTSGSDALLTSVAYGSGRFVVSTFQNDTFRSEDLVHWNIGRVGYSAPLSKVSFAGGEFIALQGERSWVATGIYRSLDGINWSYQLVEPIDARVRSSFSGAAGGPLGTVLVGGVGARLPYIYHSTGLSNWTPSVMIRVGDFGPIRFSGDRFFLNSISDAGLSGVRFWQSKDGVIWNQNLGPGVGTFSMPAFGNGLFISVGQTGQCAVSTNGWDWSLAGTGQTNDLNDVEFGGGRFTAVGELGTLLTSTNGTNWTSLDSKSDCSLITVAWNSGRWVASGNAVGLHGTPEGVPVVHPEGVVLVSTNGVVWKIAQTNGFARVVAFKQGFASSSTHLSDDGEVWRNPSGNLFTISPIFSLGSSGDLLLAASYGSSSVGTGLYSTSDGTNWVRRLIPFATGSENGGVYFLGGAAFGRGTWIVGHGSGALIQSDPVAPETPSLVEEPQTVAGSSEATAYLRVRALGTSPLSYQWSRNGQPISGATNQFLALPGAEDLTNRFRVAVSNAFGSTNSADVTITAPARPELKLVRQSSNLLEVKGTPGRRYVAQQSGDLGSSTNWTSIGLVEIDGDFPAYLSIDLPADTNRFFRAVAEP